MLHRLLLAAAGFVFAILLARWFEQGEYVDPLTNRRHCAAPPAAIDWVFTARTPRPADAGDLQRWIKANADDVNGHFGAFCWTALHAVARTGREDLAAVLIAAGVDIRTGDAQQGNTALHIAAQYGKAAVARLLVDGKADVSAGNKYGRTPLHDAVDGLAGTSDLAGRLAVAKLLISRGANVQARDRGGRSPLDEATNSSDKGGSDQMTALLLAAGASSRAARSQADSPLQQAAGSGNLAAVRQLLDRGEDPNTPGRDTTPLGAAAYQGHTEVVTLLLNRKADASRKVQDSRLEGDGAPLAMALLTDRDGSRERNARRLQAAGLLLERGADVNARDAQGATALHRAASRGQLAVVELLISHRAVVDPIDALGVTPLQLAVKEGHTAVAAYLLERGADVRLKATNGTTALELARNDREMEALLQRHAGR